jgi:hypothetical protein
MEYICSKRIHPVLKELLSIMQCHKEIRATREIKKAIKHKRFNPELNAGLFSEIN